MLHSLGILWRRRIDSMAVTAKRMSVRKTATLLALCGSAALLTLTVAPNARADQATKLAWTPDRPVEFVITTSPGGGSDLYARFITSVVFKNHIWNQPLLPANHPGGSGAVAFNYLFKHKGDPDMIMITLNSIITTPLIQGNLPFSYKDFTPISLLALDPFFLWVPEDSPFKTLDDFLAAAKKKSLTVGGTGSKQEDQTLFTMIQDKANLKSFSYVPFSGGAKVAAALIGHQLQATVNNPSEQIQYMKAGRSRALCAFLDERSATFPDVPTCKEKGLDITYFNMRAIMAAPGITAQQQKGLAQAMKEVYDSPQWQGFVKKYGLEARYKGPKEFGDFLGKFAKMNKEILTKAGWIH